MKRWERRQLLGQKIREKRLEMGWSQADFALKIGFCLPDKRVELVQGLEKGNRGIPEAYRPALLGTLGLDEPEATQVTLEFLLARECEFLMTHKDTILGREAWAGADIGGCSIGLAYIGGGRLSLGEILSLWAEGSFLSKCEECKGPFYLQYAGGSPLSGSYRAYGFCGVGKQPRKHELPRGMSIGGIAGPLIKRLRENRKHSSNLTLRDVMSDLKTETELLSK